jgi:hypothetical protein
MVEPVDGAKAKALVDANDPQKTEVIDWGSGYHGLCVYDGDVAHLILQQTVWGEEQQFVPWRKVAQ